MCAGAPGQAGRQDRTSVGPRHPAPKSPRPTDQDLPPYFHIRACRPRSGSTRPIRRQVHGDRKGGRARQRSTGQIMHEGHQPETGPADGDPIAGWVRFLYGFFPMHPGALADLLSARQHPMMFDHQRASHTVAHAAHGDAVCHTHATMDTHGRAGLSRVDLETPGVGAHRRERGAHRAGHAFPPRHETQAGPRRPGLAVSHTRGALSLRARFWRTRP